MDYLFNWVLYEQPGEKDEWGRDASTSENISWIARWPLKAGHSRNGSWNRHLPPPSLPESALLNHESRRNSASAPANHRARLLCQCCLRQRLYDRGERTPGALAALICGTGGRTRGVSPRPSVPCPDQSRGSREESAFSGTQYLRKKQIPFGKLRASFRAESPAARGRTSPVL